MTVTFAELLMWVVSNQWAADPEFDTRDTVPCGPPDSRDTIPAPPAFTEETLLDELWGVK